MDVMRSTLAHQLRKVKAARGDAPAEDGPAQDLPAQNPPADYSVQAWEAPSGRYWDKTDLKNVSRFETLLPHGQPRLTFGEMRLPIPH
jgi:hypothetical protein